MEVIPALIENLPELEGKYVEIKGWVYNKRSSGGVRFLLVRDGTGILQCTIIKSEVDKEILDKFKKLTQESSLIVRGYVKKEPRAIGGYELLLKELDIFQIAENYPITKKEHGIDFLLDHRHLWLRSRKQFAILRIRHEVISACRDYFNSRGFILLDAPIFTPSACEGTTTLFETKYFDTVAYLSQSGQLYNEAAAMAFRKVYCFGPTFRAEKSKTRRHLIEFWQVEPEIAWATLEDIIKYAEELVTYIVERVLTNRKMELDILERDVKPLENVKPPFPRITYDEAVKLIRENGLEIEDEDDFGAPHETLISQKFDKPVFVTHYPTAVKAFYMQPDPNNPKRVLCTDMLAPEGYGEIIGGSERIYDPELLIQKIKEHNLPMEAFQWYIDLRKYGTVPHSGFGLGIERTVAWICKLKHIREAIPFPRMLYRMKP